MASVAPHAQSKLMDTTLHYTAQLTKDKQMNPFTALIDWLDENADYAPIGAFIGLAIAIVLAFTFGG